MRRDGSGPQAASTALGSPANPEEVRKSQALVQSAHSKHREKRADAFLQLNLENEKRSDLPFPRNPEPGVPKYVRESIYLPQNVAYAEDARQRLSSAGLNFLRWRLLLHCCS